MIKKSMLAIALAALVASPSFAAVQNVKVSGDLKTTSVIRSKFNASSVTASTQSQKEILSTAHLNVGADLTDNVSTFFSLVNERVWGGQATTSNGTNVDLDAAYVTLKEMLYAPLSVTVGRQPLAYGNQLIIGDGDSFTNLTGATYATLADISGGVNFDAIKAVLSYDPLTVDLFAARVSNTSALSAASVDSRDNVNLYGINANYKFSDSMNSVVEAYTFAKIDDSTNDFGAGAREKSTTTYVPGLRVSTNPIEGLNVQVEGAYQLGQYNDNSSAVSSDVAQTRRGAYALQGMVNYALPVMKDMKPVLGAAYTYLSGNTLDAGTKRGWDVMYENQNAGRIFDALGYAGSNSQLATLSFEVSPVQDVVTKLSLNGLWLAEKSAYVPGGASAASSSKYRGSELDADVIYAYTEDVKLGLSAGYFMTGKKYLEPVNNNASQVLTSVSVAF